MLPHWLYIYIALISNSVDTRLSKSMHTMQRSALRIGDLVLNSKYIPYTGHTLLETTVRHRWCAKLWLPALQPLQASTSSLRAAIKHRDLTNASSSTKRLGYVKGVKSLHKEQYQFNISGSKILAGWHSVKLMGKQKSEVIITCLFQYVHVFDCGVWLKILLSTKTSVI